MSNLVGCPIGLQVALCLCHPYHFWFRPSLSVPFEIIPAWRWSFFFTKKEGTARLPTTSAGFFWVLFVREARYILFGWEQKSACLSEILSLFSEKLSNDRKYRGWHPAQLYGDYFINHYWVVVSNIFYFHPYLGKWSNLTNIFQMGWKPPTRL